jgi:hypothetical protein
LCQSEIFNGDEAIANFNTIDRPLAAFRREGPLL